VEAVQVPVTAILSLREEYRREMNCQIVHDSWHARGFTTSYLLKINGDTVGYGSVGAPWSDHRIVKEFFVDPVRRGAALPLFRQLIAVSGAREIQAQTNDVLLTLMLFDCAVDLVSETILFADAVLTTHSAPAGVTLRAVADVDRMTVFTHTAEPVGDWGLYTDDGLVATGGVLYHYNPPYGDIYMEVAAAHQRRGLGSYLVQELKRVCRETGHIPAARCGATNHASRRTLERAGMFPCARIVRGRIDVSAARPEAESR
jgi:GNAT superfamily N-acetyltransferase